MLAKKNRIKKQKDFERIFKSGKGLRHDLIFLKKIPNSLEFSRFGLVVSKKVSNKAVVRNRIKRRLRAVLKDFLKELAGGYDVVLVALPGIEKKEKGEIGEMIRRLLFKAGLLAGEAKNTN